MYQPRFQAGDVVVCIDASNLRWHEPKRLITKGSKYLVTDWGPGFPRAAVVLAGAGNHGPIAYDARRFRKADPLKLHSEAMRSLRPKVDTHDARASKSGVSV